MGLQNLFVQERLSSEQPEKGVPHFFGLSNNVIHFVDIDFFLFGGNIDPASLTTQVTAVDDRDVQKRREEVTAFQAFFMLLNGANTFEAGFVSQIPQESLVGVK